MQSKPQKIHFPTNLWSKIKLPSIKINNQNHNPQTNKTKYSKPSQLIIALVGYKGIENSQSKITTASHNSQEHNKQKTKYQIKENTIKPILPGSHLKCVDAAEHPQAHTQS